MAFTIIFTNILVVAVYAGAYRRGLAEEVFRDKRRKITSEYIAWAIFVSWVLAGFDIWICKDCLHKEGFFLIPAFTTLASMMVSVTLFRRNIDSFFFSLSEGSLKSYTIKIVFAIFIAVTTLYGKMKAETTIETVSGVASSVFGDYLTILVAIISFLMISALLPLSVIVIGLFSRSSKWNDGRLAVFTSITISLSILIVFTPVSHIALSSINNYILSEFVYYKNCTPSSENNCSSKTRLCRNLPYEYNILLLPSGDVSVLSENGEFSISPCDNSLASKENSEPEGN